MGAQAKEGKPVFERKPGASALRKGGYANSVLTSDLQSTGNSSQPLAHSPVKGIVRQQTGAASDAHSQLQTISPLQVGKGAGAAKKNTSAQHAKSKEGSGEGAQPNAGSGSFL